MLDWYNKLIYHLLEPSYTYPRLFSIHSMTYGLFEVWLFDPDSLSERRFRIFHRFCTFNLSQYTNLANNT